MRLIRDSIQINKESEHRLKMLSAIEELVRLMRKRMIARKKKMMAMTQKKRREERTRRR